MAAFFSDFVRDETGAVAAEYALIIAIMGASIAVAALALGGKISGAMDRVGAKMDEVGP